MKSVAEVSDIERKELNVKVSKIVAQIGVPEHLRGYMYIKEAIFMMLFDKDTVTKSNDTLYQEIATRCNTTKRRVEQAMIRATELMWIIGDMDFINEMFGNKLSVRNGSPITKEFAKNFSNKLDIGAEE